MQSTLPPPGSKSKPGKVIDDRPDCPDYTTGWPDRRESKRLLVQTGILVQSRLMIIISGSLGIHFDIAARSYCIADSRLYHLHHIGKIVPGICGSS